MSFFRDHPPTNVPPFSFGVSETLIARLRALDEITDLSFANAVLQSYCIIHPEDLIKQHFEQILKIVDDKLFELQKEQVEAGNHKLIKGQSLGTKYSEWLSDLDPSHLCLYLADHDIDKAKRIYWFVDQELVKEAVTFKGEHDSHLILTQMESCMYGFGGKYQTDEGGATHFDMSNGDGLSELKALGF